jgi:DnaK suppressor protein
MTESEAGELLAASRASLTGQLTGLVAELERLAAATVDSNIDDEHDPEGSTLAFERAQLTASLVRARAQLAEVDQAIDRVTAHAYGQCEGCATEIDHDRLRAIPTARRCIACASRG